MNMVDEHSGVELSNDTKRGLCHICFVRHECGEKIRVFWIVMDLVKSFRYVITLLS
jgi:hypothetical protein